MAKKQSVGTDRQAKIQAAAKTSGGGANKIIIAAVVAIVAIIAVVGWVVWSQLSAEKAIKGDGNSVPAGAAMSGGYRVYADVKAKEGAPTVDVYEDFQCPACAEMEGRIGNALETAAKAGDITLNYHVLHFLDGKLGNDGSIKAGNGAFCAAESGKFVEFHNLAYSQQPTEGAGWTTAGLKSLASEAGITGPALDTWTKCVDLGKYTNYIKSVDTEAFTKGGIKGTPSFKINGTDVSTKDISTPELLKAYLEKVTKK